MSTIRLFPTMPLGGAAFVQAVATTFPEGRFISSGGIGPQALRPLLAPPSVIAVSTSGIAHPDLVKVRNYDRIEWMAREATRAVPRSR